MVIQFWEQEIIEAHFYEKTSVSLHVSSKVKIVLVIKTEVYDRCFGYFPAKLQRENEKEGSAEDKTPLA